MLGLKGGEPGRSVQGWCPHRSAVWRRMPTICRPLSVPALVCHKSISSKRPHSDITYIVITVSARLSICLDTTNSEVSHRRGIVSVLFTVSAAQMTLCHHTLKQTFHVSSPNTSHKTQETISPVSYFPKCAE